MKLRSDDPPRLLERRDQPNLAERIAGQALRDLAHPAQLAPSAMARIAARVDGRDAGERRPARLGWVLAAAAFLLGLATAASAAHLDLVPDWLSRLVQAKPRLVSHQHASPTVSKHRGSLPGASPSSSEPSVAPSPTPPVETFEPAPVLPVAKPRAGEREQASGQPQPNLRQKGRREARGEGAEPPKPPALAVLADGPRPLPAASEIPAFVAPPPPVSATGVQVPLPAALPTLPQPAAQPAPPPRTDANQTAKHLKEVIQALRVDHSPKSALALLDRHKGEFAGSAFGDEVLLLRVESMLALGRRGEVLRLLDGTSLTDVMASQALLVTRGELRAAANRCSAGIGDFDLVIAVARRPPKQALLGRASCRQKLGDEAGAKADLERVRREYPGE